MPQRKPNDKIILSYFADWSVYGRKFFPWDIPADKLTHINFSFADLTPSGELAFHDDWSSKNKRYPERGDSWNDPAGHVYGNIKHLFELKKRNRHLKVLLSVGGWTLSKHFPSVLADPGKRSTFVRSSIDFMVRHGFDGLDFDPEWLGAVGNPHNEPPRPDDGDNFALFLAELRAALAVVTPKREWLVTLAGPADPGKIEAAKVGLWHHHLDYLSIMAYDYEGSWSSSVGHLANLKGSSSRGEGFSTDKAVNKYLSVGVPAHKIVMGVPFYSRGFANVESGWGGPFSGVPPMDQASYKWEPGTSDYRGINNGKATGADGTELSDLNAVAARCVGTSKRTYWSYDNPETMALKMDYINERGLGGAMSWSIDGDLPYSDPRSLSKVIYNKLAPSGLDHSQNILHFPESQYTNINNMPYETPAPSVPSVPAPSVPSAPAPSVPSVPAPSVPSVPAPSTPSVPAPSTPSVPAPSVPSVPYTPQIPGAPIAPVIPPWVPVPEPTPSGPSNPTESGPSGIEDLMNLKTIHVSFDLNLDKSEIANGKLNFTT